MAQVKELQLRVIYDPEWDKRGLAKVDLVLLHGFGGDFIDTWTFKDANSRVFWPKDLLPGEQDQPPTRVLSFGYDAGELVVASIGVYAQAMLAYLRTKRVGIEKRPIIFLGHCLGGLIVKQAMRFSENDEVYKSIISATKLIMFFGTPHGGGNKKDWKKLAKSYKGLGRRCRMIDILGRRTKDLEELDEDFIRLQERFMIVNFLEQQNMPGAKKPIVGSMCGVKFSRHPSIPVDGNHITMCQFKNTESNAFTSVCGLINEAVGNQAPDVKVPLQTPADNQQVTVTQQITIIRRTVINGPTHTGIETFREATAAQVIELPDPQALREYRVVRPTANQKLLKPAHPEGLVWRESRDMSLETVATRQQNAR